MFTLELRDGERRVLDLRASRRLVVTNVSDWPVAIVVERRAQGGWATVSGEVLLPPRRRWWGCASEIGNGNAVVGVHGNAGVPLVRVSY
jgi:hypothetical protein